jgi:LCP family protein required for cell wall assembly
MPPSGARLVRHARAPQGIGRALGWTVVGAVLPGTALLVAGRRGGATVLALFGLLVAAAVWLATAGRRTALFWAVDPRMLLLAAFGLVLLAMAWVLVVISGYVALLPRRASRRRRRTGAVVVLALCVAGVAPALAAANLAVQQRGLVQGVFAEDRRSATVRDVGDGGELFGGRERLNLLLLGGDGGEGRDGVRTDTVMVASIDVATGDTTLISLPRNLDDLPFPPGSPLDRVYPDGFDGGSEDESLLNAVYRNGPREHPDLLGPSDDLGADFLKLGVGEALGLEIHYYVLVNLEGFSRLVDALGGVTVDVNYYVPVGGNPGTGRLPDAYLAPGPDQRMDGATALAFARGRFGLSDYQRMDRQRCVVDAMVDQADPLSLATRYGELVDTAQDIVSTDLPQSLVDDAVEVALRVKDAEVRSLVVDDTVIEPAYPDYDEIRRLVRDAVAGPPPAPGPSAGSSADPSAGGGPAPAGGPSPAGASGGAASAEVSSAEQPVDDIADACAYDPLRAQRALDEGQPPTYGD